MTAVSVRTFESVEPIRTIAEDYLLRAEAEHNLLFGLFDRLTQQQTRADDAALALLGDQVVGVALSAPLPGQLLVLSRMTERVAQALADALARLPLDVPAVKGPPAPATAFAIRWSALRKRRPIPGLLERILALRSLRSPPPAPGRALIAGSPHLELLGRWCEAFARDISARHPTSSERIQALVAAGAVELWQKPDGELCSMAATVRGSPNGAVISWVYTPPAQRNRGYAASCVAALCQRLLARGKDFCCLYADSDNPTSNGLYTRLGFEAVATTREFRFEPQTA